MVIPGILNRKLSMDLSENISLSQDLVYHPRLSYERDDFRKSLTEAITGKLDHTAPWGIQRQSRFVCDLSNISQMVRNFLEGVLIRVSKILLSFLISLNHSFTQPFFRHPESTLWYRMMLALIPPPITTIFISSAFLSWQRLIERLDEGDLLQALPWHVPWPGIGSHELRKRLGSINDSPMKPTASNSCSLGEPAEILRTKDYMGQTLTFLKVIVLARLSLIHRQNSKQKLGQINPIFRPTQNG